MKINLFWFHGIVFNIFKKLNFFRVEAFNCSALKSYLLFYFTAGPRGNGNNRGRGNYRGQSTSQASEQRQQQQTQQ